MPKYTNRLWYENNRLPLYDDAPKTYISGVTDHFWVSGVANFIPIFEFNQE